jgi:hypothetical protein
MMLAEPGMPPTENPKPSSGGLSGKLGKITAVLVTAAALIGAADGLINQAESFTCKRLWSGFMWCDATHAERSYSTGQSNDCGKLPSDACDILRKRYRESVK